MPQLSQPPLSTLRAATIAGRSRATAALLLAGLLLGGCGETPTQSTGGTATRTIVSVPGTNLGDFARNHLGGTAYDDGRGADLLYRARRTMATAPGFEAEFIARAFGRYSEGQDTGEAREVSNRYKVFWARPAMMRADVLDSSEGDLKGARLKSVETGGYLVRAPGLRGLISRQLAGDDARLKNARGHALNTVSPEAQFARLSSSQAIWTVIGEGRTREGAPTVRIGVQGVTRLDEEIDREEIEIETGSLAMYQYAAYVGMRRVLGADFFTFRWTLPPAESFKI